MDGFDFIVFHRKKAFIISILMIITVFLLYPVIIKVEGFLFRILITLLAFPSYFSFFMIVVVLMHRNLQEDKSKPIFLKYILFIFTLFSIALSIKKVYESLWERAVISWPLSCIAILLLYFIGPFFVRFESKKKIGIEIEDWMCTFYPMLTGGQLSFSFLYILKVLFPST